MIGERAEMKSNGGAGFFILEGRGGCVDTAREVADEDRVAKWRWAISELRGEVNRVHRLPGPSLPLRHPRLHFQ